MQHATRSQPQDGHLLKLAGVSERTQLARSTIYALARIGRFPRPIRIGKHSRWIAGEVDQFIADLAAAR
jgi:predicted DNA-binding transcriptional regulator AlpA